MAVERTFSILKPDATARNLTGAINAMIEQAGLRIVAQKRVRITREQAETFYGVHRERPFFGELVDFMISGPVVVQVLEGENAIAKYRDVMGATDPAKAAAGHHPQGPRQVDRRELGARFRRAGHGGEGNRAVLLRQRDRRLTAMLKRGVSSRSVRWSLGHVGRAVRLALRSQGALTHAATARERLGNRQGSAAVGYLWADMMHAGVLDRRRPDHLDQHPSLRRQRRRDRAGLPLAAAAAALLGHPARRRRRRAAAHLLHHHHRADHGRSPFLKLVGGLLLLWIAVKLIVPSEEHGEDSVKAGDTLWRAVWLVTVADIVMSLDNVIAIAAAAETAAMRVDIAHALAIKTTLIIFGLATSVPLIIAGSALLMAVLERFPILVWAGAALLGWVAGEIMVKDAAVVG